MALSLHHCFILANPGAPQANLLSAAGLTEGSSNSHPGQGTANRRFFFSNTTLELLYLRDANEARREPAHRLRLVDRLEHPDASPFGIVVSRTTAAATPPFRGWRYYPDYFDAERFFQIGENSDRLLEPLCICMPDDLPPATDQTEPDNAGWNLAELRISVPLRRVSSTLGALARCPGIKLILERPHHMEMVFDGTASSRQIDLTPRLPLTIEHRAGN